MTNFIVIFLIPGTAYNENNFKYYLKHELAGVICLTYSTSRKPSVLYRVSDKAYSMDCECFKWFKKQPV